MHAQHGDGGVRSYRSDACTTQEWGGSGHTGLMHAQHGGGGHTGLMHAQHDGGGGGHTGLMCEHKQDGLSCQGRRNGFEIGGAYKRDIIFIHPPKRRRVTYASTIRPASASTLSTSSMKPLHGIISYCTCILV